MVMLQKAVEVRIAGETFVRKGNIGIPDQRARRGTASVVAFAAQRRIMHRVRYAFKLSA
jgi:hypothetical protein